MKMFWRFVLAFCAVVFTIILSLGLIGGLVTKSESAAATNSYDVVAIVPLKSGPQGVSLIEFLDRPCSKKAELYVVRTDSQEVRQDFGDDLFGCWTRDRDEITVVWTAIGTKMMPKEKYIIKTYTRMEVVRTPYGKARNMPY